MSDAKYYPRWRRDVILLAAVVVLAAALQFSVFKAGTQASEAVVTAHGETVVRLALGTDTIYTYEFEEETNEIVVENGGVFIRRANCKGQDCVRQGRIDRAGQSIVCLPHKLIIELAMTDANEPEIDIIVR
ncbi:MAG: NusG domain II-containing protein [Oscillospiraceae bacterium]|jgi:hypothetical protein|nr:NusG domain II-containing protein [Oscillospiraceae bacterium]